jgi:hypothetical protein
MKRPRAIVHYNFQTPAEWRVAAMTFIAANPNWSMKFGFPDVSHIEASAARCGFDHIDGDNWPEVAHMIVAAHEAKAADAHAALETAGPDVGDGENMP